MQKLLEESKNTINQVRSMDAIAVAAVLSKAKKIADDLATANPDQTPPTTTTIIIQTDTHKEADHLNMSNQAIIGIKESATEAIRTMVGSVVLNFVLCTADGADNKGVDKC